MLTSLLLPAQAGPAGAAGPIIPGKRIGNVHIGETEDQVIAALGKPAGRDMSMGREIAVWNLFQADNPTRLDVLFFRQESDNQLHVTNIRVNSNAFRTGNKLAVGSTLAEVEKHFPDAQKTALDAVHKTVYDSVSHGIAFEVDGDKVAAVTVHAPGKPEGIASVTLP